MTVELFQCEVLGCPEYTELEFDGPLEIYPSCSVHQVSMEIVPLYECEAFECNPDILLDYLWTTDPEKARERDMNERVELMGEYLAWKVKLHRGAA